MMKRMRIAALILGIVSPAARAGTWNWTTPVDNSWFTNASSWAENSVPANDGSADLVLTNALGGEYTSRINEDWSVNSLRYLGGAAGFTIQQNGTRTLNVGAGGITGTNRWFHLRPNVTFTASDVGLNYGNLYFYGTLDSSAPGGTLLRVRGENWQYVQTYASRSTSNITWSIEGGQIANYGVNPNDFLGPNRVLVGGPNSGQRYVGYYGNTASNDLYIDSDFEIDAAIIDNSPCLNFVINRGHSTAGLTQITHLRGKLSTRDGVAFTNTSGIGVFQFYGGANDMRKKIYHEADNSGLISAPITPGAWSGDFAINSGWHVVNSAHAFKTNNSAWVNLSDLSGGTTSISNRQFLLKDGITFSGDVAISGGSSLADKSQASAWVGIEGTGSAEYAGRILIHRWDNHATYGNRGFNAVFYAGNGGTAVFSGNMQDLNGGESVTGQKVFITGGGTVVFAGTCTYTNRTTVMSNTTFQADGSLASEIEVLAGSTLKGGGSSSANMILGGDFAPGASLGTFTAYADVDFLGGSTLTIELGPGGSSDLLDAYADLDITGATLRLVGGDAGSFTIARYSTLTGTFASIDTTGLSGGVTFDSIGYGSGSGDSITLTVIPEPASVLLMAGGLVAAWNLRRRG